MRYQVRPSVWIQPDGHWGQGAVTLIEIPTPDETNDNIVAFWQPAVLPRIGQPYSLNYHMLWNGEGPPESTAKVVQTFASARFPKRPTRFAIDFGGRELTKRAGRGALKGRVHCDPWGQVSGVRLMALKPGIVQLTFSVTSLRDRPVHVEAALLSHGRIVSEVWDYVIAPENGPMDVPGHQRTKTP